MKYVVIIPDGCADEPQSELDGKTPLESAITPNMDAVAAAGIVGSANHTPRHLPAGSDVANMSLLGYDPENNFTGRAPIEAAAQGIELADDDWAIRCNLVTVQNQIMTSFTADHITSSEAKLLMQTAQQKIAGSPLQFVPGVSFRNLLLYRSTEQLKAPFSQETRTTPPHDLSDKTIENDFPRGPGSELLENLMSQSVEWFNNHSVNKQRCENGLLPATNVWLWGIGKQPRFQPFSELFQLNGAMITAVDLLHGLAKLIGWDRIDVPGATGYVDTDYMAKGRYAIDAIEQFDIVCVHIEATDEASHEGDLNKKIHALERIDEDIVGPIFTHLGKFDDWRMLITPDHPTYIRTKTHTHGDVPFAMCGSRIKADANQNYHERNAADSTIRFNHGFKLMPKFISADDF